MRSRSRFLWTWAGLISVAAATPQLGYPFNSQLPPVARPGESYTYTLPSTTFSSTDGSSLNYTATNLPDWLSFDAASRTLSGTPPSQSGDDWVKFDIIATDDSGATANDTATLVLSSIPQPGLDSNAVSSTLRGQGAMAGASALVLTPGQQFNIEFPSDVFDTTGNVFGYYGVVDDHTPLPQWINFDGSIKQFTGVAPSVNSQIAPAQWFNFIMIVSETEGFESNHLAFSIVVGAHDFATNMTEDVLNVTAGNYFEYHIPLTNITLDGVPVQQANITSISLNNTSLSWISLNANNSTISGTAPANSNDDTVLQVSLNDYWQDTVSYSLLIAINGANDTIFTSNSLNPVNATQGEFFVYDISPFLTNENATVDVTTRPEAQWLNYFDANKTFTGTVPNNFTQTDVTLDATSGSKTETASFYIRGVSKTAKATATSAAPTSSSTSGASVSATSATSKAVSDKTIAIVCGVVIPTVVLFAALLLWCCIRKRKTSTMITSDTYNSPGRKEISRPYPMNPDDPEMLMAPVFPARSGDTSTAAYSDALTPPTDKLGEKNGQFEDGWDTPQRVSAFNFMKMDGATSDDVSSNYYRDAETINEPLQPPPAPNSANTASPSGNQSPAATVYATPPQHHPAPSQQVNATAVTTPEASGSAGAAVVGAPRPINHPNSEDGIPRNSWRNSDMPPEGRWQEHQSLGSLATISTDELLTMRLVDRNSAGTPTPRDSFMRPTDSTILTPHHSMYASDDSSGIIHPVGSHSSTLQQHSQANSMATATSGVVGVPTTSNAATHPLAVDNARNLQPSRTETDDSYGEHYRTASSGEEYDDFDNGSLASDGPGHIRPYRNSRGELSWSHYGDFDNDGSISEGTDTGAAAAGSKRDTVRLRDIRQGSQSGVSSKPSLESTAGRLQQDQSVSAELAFL